jgi:hypothetical protein
VARDTSCDFLHITSVFRCYEKLKKKKKKGRRRHKAAFVSVNANVASFNSASRSQ